MEDLEKLAEAVSLLADCIESHNNTLNNHNKTINRLISMYQMSEKMVEDHEKAINTTLDCVELLDKRLIKLEDKNGQQ